MKTIMQRSFFSFLLILPVMLAAGCSAGGGGGGSDTPATYSVSGSIPLPAGAVGKTLRILLDTNANYSDGAVFSLETILVSGSEYSYTFTDVAEGSYYVFASLDMDGNGTVAPNNGDYAGYHQGSGKTPPAAPSLEVDDADVSGANITLAEIAALLEVRGTVTFPADAYGKRLIMVLDGDSNLANGYAQSVIVDSLGHGTSYDYTFSDVEAGSYFVSAAVDVDGDTGLGPNNGDYAGYLEGNNSVIPPQPPVVAPLNVSASSVIDRDFSLITVSGLIEVSGTITLPAAQPGKYLGVALIEDFTDLNTIRAANLYPLTAGQKKVNYIITYVPDGTFYLIGAVDIDADNAYDRGDYLGLYGYYLFGPNVTINGESRSGLNFSLTTLTVDL